MRKFTAFAFILLSLCFVLTSCHGTNYPGAVKAKYWVSEDETMHFYFPAEAGRGNAAGRFFINDDTTLDLILEWDTRSGIVEVQTAGYEKVFTARTTTNEAAMTCTFEIISQEEGYRFPAQLTFRWQQSAP
ncbi:MAG: hypothetical protein E7436_00690 [Ruminococcaceae bacterium]|nr:hypothetical protein [Oscillospiraceae bacterium]